MAFSIRDTLESGQVFRWRYTEGGALLGHADKVHFIPDDGEVEDEDLKHLLREDMPQLEHEHPYVQEAIKSIPGLRVLRQDPWECLVTFIISQNNHQKRIQKNCFSIAEEYGKPLEHGMHAFPRPHELGDEQQLRELGLGYRAKWIAQLRDIDLDWLYGLSEKSYEQAKKELCQLKGIGPKVADCILLFSQGFDEACPEDVWIKRVFEQNDLTREDLGNKAGLYQQYLFHHSRSS